MAVDLPVKGKGALKIPWASPVRYLMLPVVASLTLPAGSVGEPVTSNNVQMDHQDHKEVIKINKPDEDDIVVQ